MPELPEVETIVRGLLPRVRGRRIESVWWSGQGLHLGRKVDLRGLRAVAVGRAVARVRRRGKYILIEVAGGEDEGVVVHLGMTGRLRVQPAAAARAAHTHVVFALAGGDELRFTDARRFGWVAPGRPLAADPALAALGPDPLSELDAPALASALAEARAPIKAFLLDQRRIAGLGNIYVAEALFRVGAHPATPARRLARRAAALLAAVRETLEGGIARRGTTLRDYVDADGLEGDNAAALLVYGRAGEPCTRCGAPIRRRVDGGRATFFCPRCQRR
ncbi:MAG TPA: bifunctional DNA-formamidopyrimidine glycosylase/DNA-(apurinic or apyrimidinic site) lyase [Polyangia bacterium]|nr:bifunctional DNA-formamidopyrimidine glycosylase/DNA-(apurinic or apyrimidinic site) lyase [Polyangia bacterium]